MSLSLVCDLDNKFFQALVNGLTKRRSEGELKRRRFFKDATITSSLLKEQIFSSSKMTEERPSDLVSRLSEITAFIDSCDRTLEQCAQEAWTAAQLEKYL